MIPQRKTYALTLALTLAVAQTARAQEVPASLAQGWGPTVGRQVVLAAPDRVDPGPGDTTPSQFTRSYRYDCPGAVEVVVWIEVTDGSGSVEFRELADPAGGRHPLVARASAAQPVGASAWYCARPTSLEVSITRTTAGVVRVGHHERALDPSARESILSIARGLPQRRGGSPGELEAQLGADLDGLLGVDGVFDGWEDARAGAALAAVAGRAGLASLAARSSVAAVAQLETLLPERSSYLLDARADEVRALTAAGRGAEALERLPDLRATLEALRGPGDPRSLQLAQVHARCLRSLGDLEGAHTMYGRALEEARGAQPPDHTEIVRLLHNTAAAAFELRDLWRSLQLEREALAHLDAHGLSVPDFRRAVALQMALTTRMLGFLDPDTVEGLEEVARVLRSELGPEHEEVLRLESNLALELVHRGCVERALELAGHVDACRRATLGPAHPQTLLAQSRLVETLSAAGWPEASAVLGRDLLRTRESRLPAGHGLLFESRLGVARDLVAAGRTEEALRLRAAAALGLRHALATLAASSWRERRERAAELRQRLERLVGLGELTGVDRDWEHELFALFETSRAAAAAGPLRADTTAGTLSELDGASSRIAELRRAVAEARAALASATPSTSAVPAHASGASAETAEEWNALVDATVAVDRAESELAAVLAARGTTPFRTVEVADLVRALPAGSAAVGLTVLGHDDHRPVAGLRGGAARRTRYHAVTASGRWIAGEGPATDELERAVARWRVAIGEPLTAAKEAGPVDEGASPVRDARPDPGRELADLVLGDLLRSLGDTQTLYVCSEGPLDLVPLDALPLGKGLVGDRLRVRMLSSFDELLRSGSDSRPASLPRRFVGVGDVAHAAAGAERIWPRLPGTRAEVEAVARLFEAQGATSELLLGRAATPAAVARALERASHAIVATHGYVAHEPADRERSEPLGGRALSTALAPLALTGLVLAGAPPGGSEPPSGLWTGAQIVAADLTSLELAVLSACDTRAGFARSGQGLFSLQRALHAAGARASLTSLWRVKSDYGRVLVERFFTAYLAGEDAAEALWSAKTHLRRELALPARFWAGWVLTGTTRLAE